MGDAGDEASTGANAVARMPMILRPQQAASLTDV